MPELLHTALPGLPPPRVGKVREVYDLGDAVLLIATDRISAFDVVMANGIPDKGAILNRMSAFWFDHLKDICPSHFISIEAADIDKRLNAGHPELHGRSLLAQKADPLPVECVARGYLTGSLYKQYVQSGGKNPRDSSIFLPVCATATKAAVAPIFAGDQGDRGTRREHFI